MTSSTFNFPLWSFLEEYGSSQNAEDPMGSKQPDPTVFSLHKNIKTLIKVPKEGPKRRVRKQMSVKSGRGGCRGPIVTGPETR